ncbi:type VII secretion AAA-ATPase EccA [Mycolicibacterium sp.]|uniref:type VII secretion AAA-ATPase EccA n=1 Tax=Mycolicibacterium sp. TaxID=2320850 RepID=UPI0037C64900
MAANLDPNLVYYFNNGITALLQKDMQGARESFVWCRDEISDEQADVHRGLAWLDSTAGPATAEHLAAMYRTRHTWGRLLEAAGRARGQALPANMLEARVAVIRELGIDSVYRCPEVAVLGHASVLIEQGRYDEALETLDSAQRPLPMLALARMNLFVKTHRWADVIEAGQSILNPPECTKDGEPLDRLDEVVSGISNFFIGMAHAHLGNFEAADFHLGIAAQREYRDVNVEIAYLRALMDRHAGNEQAAIARLNAGQGYKFSEKLQAAANDPSIRLHVTTAQLINQRTAYWDRGTEPSLDEIREEEVAERKSSLLAEAEAELDRQIGMAEVKEQITRRKDKIAWDAEAARRGVAVPGQSLHLAFTGPPGTGKTTIARVVAKIYCGLGLLKKETVLEVGRDDLVGAFIGETEKKTSAVIDSALDGVLFIDEAYSLVAPSAGGAASNDFGLVAINTLLARMENDRDRLVVIVAGYEKDINALMAVNEGLGSRFANRVRFHSYSPEEIGEIAEVMAAGRGSILSTQAKELIASETRSRMMVGHSSGHMLLDVAGNGRFVRNVIERAEEFRSSRLAGQNLAALSNEELFGLSIEDTQRALNSLIDPLLGINDQQGGH